MDSGPDRPGTEHDRTVVSALARLAPLTAPTIAERSRIRARILDGLPELSDEPAGPPGATTTTSRARPAVPGRAARTRRGPRGPRNRPDSDRPDRSGRPVRQPARAVSGARGRFAVAAVAVLALVGSLVGMSLLLSRDALPGDALYGMKRTAEAAELGLTFGDEGRALKHLEFASARVSEIETLARRYPDRDSAPVGSYLTALTDFDNDAAAGSRQLVAVATTSDGRQLDSLTSWAKQQSSRLTAVSSLLPAAARNRASASLALLDKISTRAGALSERLDCYQITSGSADDVGALPASGACEQPSGSRPNPGAPGGEQGGTSVQPTVPPSGAGGAAPGHPTGKLPPLPPVGRTVEPQPSDNPSTDGTPSQPPASDEGSINLPLPLPGVTLPPLLPGLPGISIGK